MMLHGKDVAQVAAGELHSIAITRAHPCLFSFPVIAHIRSHADDGVIYMWGDNSNSQLGPNTRSGKFSATPSRVPGAALHMRVGDPAVQISCGTHHTLLATGMPVFFL